MEVTLDELLNGYSWTADYQKKTQSLAEQRKAVEAERVKIEEAAKTRETYSQRLQVIEQLLQQQDKGEDLLCPKDRRSYCLCSCNGRESREGEAIASGAS